jgi:hypothetical protein
MPEAVETEAPSLVDGGGSRVVGLVAAVVAPTTLITALAYYFGYRRERAFAGFFGIDVSALIHDDRLRPAECRRSLRSGRRCPARRVRRRLCPSVESTAKGQLTFTC